MAKFNIEAEAATFPLDEHMARLPDGVAWDVREEIKYDYVRHLLRRTRLADVSRFRDLGGDVGMLMPHLEAMVMTLYDGWSDAGRLRSIPLVSAADGVGSS
jgi:hypothetical protein